MKLNIFNFKLPRRGKAVVNLIKTVPGRLGVSPTPSQPKSGWQALKPLAASRREWLIGGAVAILLVVGGILGSLYLYKKTSQVSRAGDHGLYPPGKAPAPTIEPSRLTGVPVPVELNKRPVTGVMIENSLDARPQSGLKDAGVVFEAIAEGGITRFLALYQEAQPDYIGPVRSVRPYYLDWVAQFDAAIAHHGGSAEGLAKIKIIGIKDLESGGAFRRVSNRFSPHNLYTDMASLDRLSQSRGYTESKFTSWPRKKEKASESPNASSIDLNVSGILYNPHYDYDSSSNSYKRSLNRAPHRDERSGAQITPKVVIALVIKRSQAGIYSVYQTIGSGTVFVFQDGSVTKGSWSKAGLREQMVFKTEDGQPLKLNPGQTWITLITSDGAAVYK